MHGLWGLFGFILVAAIVLYALLVLVVPALGLNSTVTVESLALATLIGIAASRK